MNNRFKVGMAQMKVLPDDPEANFSRAEQMVRDAAAAGCRLVILPECMDLGWMSPGSKTLAQPIPGVPSDRLSAMAQRHRLHLVAGLTECGPDGSIYNAAILLAPNGEILLKHRKINELKMGQALYSLGSSLAVARTELGTIGLAICADLLPGAASIGHALGHMRAQLIASPAAWAVAPPWDEQKQYGAEWLESYVPLSRRFETYIFGVSNVGRVAAGPWKDYPIIGSSLAVGPTGALLARGPFGPDQEALLTVDAHLVPRPLQDWDVPH